MSLYAEITGAVSAETSYTNVARKNSYAHPLFTTALYGHQIIRQYVYDHIKNKASRYIAIDGPPTVDWEYWKKVLTADSRSISCITTQSLSKDDNTLLSFIDSAVTEQEFSLGSYYPPISLLFDRELLTNIQDSIKEYSMPLLVIGPGATSVLDSYCDLLIYIHVPQDTLPNTTHTKRIKNLFISRPLPESEAYTRAQNVDRPILEQELCKIFPRISLFVDDQRDKFPVAIEGDALRSALCRIYNHPFCTLPHTTTEVGTQTLITELISPESSVLLYDTNEVLVSFPFSSIVNIHPQEILGITHARFHNALPIHCLVSNTAGDTRHTKPENITAIRSQVAKYFPSKASQILNAYNRDRDRTTRAWLLDIAPYSRNTDSPANNMSTHSKPILLEKEVDYLLEQIPIAPESCYNLYSYTLRGTLSIQTNASALLCMVIEGDVLQWYSNGYQGYAHYAEAFLIPANAVSVRLEAQSKPVKLICCRIKPKPYIEQKGGKQNTRRQEQLDTKSIICLDIKEDMLRSGVVQNNPSLRGNIHSTPLPNTPRKIPNILADIIRTEAKHVKQGNAPIPVAINISETLQNSVGEDLLGTLYKKLPRDSQWNIHIQEHTEAASLGEALYGIGQRTPRILGLTLDTEFDSTYIVNGEIQHIPHRNNKDGKLSTWPVNGYTVARAGSIYWNKVNAADVFSTHGFMSIASLAGIQDNSPEVIADLAAQGNMDARNAFESYGKLLGIFLSEVVDEIPTNLIILHGCIACAAPYFLYKVLQPLRIPVRPGILGDWAVFAGLAKYFIH